MLTLRKIENVPTGANNRPKLAVKIVGQWRSGKSLECHAVLTLLQSVVKCNSVDVLHSIGQLVLMNDHYIVP